MPVVPPRTRLRKNESTFLPNHQKGRLPNMLNHVILIGHLGRDPEAPHDPIRQTVAN